MAEYAKGQNLNTTNLNDESLAQMNDPFIAQQMTQGHNQEMSMPQLPQPQFQQNQQQQNENVGQMNQLATTNFILGQFSDYNQYQNILQARGTDKLQYMQRCIINKMKVTCAGDPMICCRGFGVHYAVKLDKGDPNVIFNININEPNCCQDKLKGQITSLQYQIGNPTPIEEEVYQVDYDRNCCLGKILCGAFPIFGWYQCLFYGATGCCNAKAQIRRSGQEQVESKFNFTCCYKTAQVTDSGDHPKYNLKSHHSEWCTGHQIKYLSYDNKDQEIIGRKIERKNQGRQRGTTQMNNDDYSICVVFPQSASVDEKMSLIFAGCQQMGF